MADRHAKTHTHKSNRARDNLERKVVYKSVLDNPFQVRWPNVPENIQNAVLARVISALDGVADANAKAQAASWKRKRAKQTTGAASKKLKTAELTSSVADIHVDLPTQPDNEASHPYGDAPAPSSDDAILPPIHNHLTVGINEVTKSLELVAKYQRSGVPPEQPDSLAKYTQNSRLVVVCLPDINPPILVGHLPNLVAACNSIRSSGDHHKTWLVPLPKGAEQALAAAIGLKRVATIAIEGSAPQFSSIEPLLESIPVVTAPWLCPTPAARAELVPTHIKQLKTTAPKDMRAAKELRAKGRAETKLRKQAKAAKIPKKVVIAVP
ncbi:hypothetical protein PsYK624_159100 [Phanerochaete sordida]|uniref:Uncharacterized protein n=1 Tax=Phanerochaete sordida TaxID=48140 RepID=A0A9P3LMF3_9APHY|nr:hypothetical protein PsYK624_159100 [Phanerochaete sordida]